MARRRWQQGQLYKEGRYWKVRYYEDYITKDGKIGRRKARPINIGPAEGPGRLTEKQALKKKAEIMREVNEDSHHPQSLMTLNEYIEYKFIPDHVIHCKPAGQKHYAYIIEKHIEPTIGEMELRDLKVDHVRKLIGAKARDYSRQTLKHIRTVLRTVIDHARDAGYFVGDNPAAAKIKLPDREPKRVEAYTWEEARLILKHLPSPIYEMAFLSVTTSLNVAELLGVRVGCVNLSDERCQRSGEVLPASSIAVRENYYEGKYGSLKAGSRRRFVAIPSPITGPLAVLCKGKPADAPLFANRTGRKPIDPHNVTNRLFKKLTGLLGIKVNWHRFRHCNATFTDFLGMETADRKHMMGHASDGTTAHYTHPFERLRVGSEAIAEKLLAADGLEATQKLGERGDIVQ